MTSLGGLLGLAAQTPIGAAIDETRRKRGVIVPALAALAVWRHHYFCVAELLAIFGLCVMLFHFANAPLLPLVGQKLAAAYPKEATAMMSSCIVAAQLVMLPVAVVVGRTADKWGRKPLFLVGFAVLPVRAALYTLSDNSFWLIGVQLLDGVGAGIFGALTPLVIADIMRGTGRYNLAQGGIATVQGIGASLSGLVAGIIVDRFGYSAAFLTSAAAAAVALTVFTLAMPETVEPKTS